MVGPDFVRPAPPEAERYTKEMPEQMRSGAVFTADGKDQKFNPDAAIAADWWRLFNSPELDGTVRQAVENNFTLQSAQASLAQSQQNLSAGYGVFYPTIDIGFSALRQRASTAQFGVNAARGVFNLFTLSTAINYALDISGGERRTVEALGAQVDYQRYTMLATYLTLSGNVINTMIARAAYRAQIQATEELIARQYDQLRIAHAQVAGGTANYASVLSIQSEIAASRATIAPLLQKSDQAQHLLSTLAGRLPSEWEPPEIDIAGISLPQELPLTLPSELVRRRPDILASEAQLHAASAGIGVATAALFPSFSLSAAYGLHGNTIGAVPNSSDEFWSIGPSVNFRLFEGGASWYRREAATEAYRKSLADYRQTVLNAFAQVADTLKAIEHDAQGVQAQAEALEAARQSLTLLEANYQAGVVGYLDVLAADVRLLQARLNYVQAAAQRLQDTTALFLALGGGWWNAPPLEGGLSARQQESAP